MKQKTFYNIHEAKTHLSAIAEFVASGAEVVIGKAGVPVMVLVPYDSSRSSIRTLGFAKGEGVIHDGFYQELSQEDLGDMI